MTDSFAAASAVARSTAGDIRRQGGWLPGDQDGLEAWLAGHRERVAAKGGEVPQHPVLAEFQALVDSDPVVRMYLSEMIAQVPRNRKYRKRHLESVPQMLRLVNEVLTMAPEYNEDAMVILPLGAILDWTMGTPAGFAAFRDRRINAMLKKILGVWCEFLSSGDSRYVLNDSPSGWKGEAARRAIGIEQYQYDPDAEYWGFTSWNDFFTRRLADGARPSHTTRILPWCESAPSSPPQRQREAAGDQGARHTSSPEPSDGDGRPEVRPWQIFQLHNDLQPGSLATQAARNGNPSRGQPAVMNEGVAVIGRIRPWLPILLALSANSPFWRGRDGAHASFRYQAWTRWPSAGPPPKQSPASSRAADDGRLSVLLRGHCREGLGSRAEQLSRRPLVLGAGRLS